MNHARIDRSFQDEMDALRRPTQQYLKVSNPKPLSKGERWELFSQEREEKLGKKIKESYAPKKHMFHLNLRLSFGPCPNACAGPVSTDQ